MPAEVRIRDERTITVPVPATPQDSVAFADFVAQADNDGYVLMMGSAVQQGQRDPVTTAIRLMYRKGGVPNT